MRHNMFTGQEMAKDTLSKDSVGIGNRGPHRWSLGGLYSSGHMLHTPEWVHLIDPPTIIPVLNVSLTVKVVNMSSRVVLKMYFVSMPPYVDTSFKKI